MTGDRVHIDTLQLNIPGLSPDDARRLGKDVQTFIIRHLPPRLSCRRLGALNLKIRLPQGAPRERLAELIARQICESLR